MCHQSSSSSPSQPFASNSASSVSASGSRTAPTTASSRRGDRHHGQASLPSSSRLAEATCRAGLAPEASKQLPLDAEALPLGRLLTRSGNREAEVRRSLDSVPPRLRGGLPMALSGCARSTRRVRHCMTPTWRPLTKWRRAQTIRPWGMIGFLARTGVSLGGAR
jgi:hypothetical protein